jgi:hypothetical protein
MTDTTGPDQRYVSDEQLLAAYAFRTAPAQYQPRHEARPVEIAAQGDRRAARPGELCSCNRPATVVYLTSDFGGVGSCGLPGAQKVPEPGHIGEHRPEVIAERISPAGPLAEEMT